MGELTPFVSIVKNFNYEKQRWNMDRFKKSGYR